MLRVTPAHKVNVSVFVGLGANLGDAAAAVLKALWDLANLPGTTVLRQSSLYRTGPVDSSGPDYVNAVAEIETSLQADDLLTQLQRLESLAGRERPFHNAPRTLDLDILMYGDAVIHTASLQVPHPRMWQRAFVLAPLAEIAPQLVSATQLAVVAGQGVRRLP